MGTQGAGAYPVLAAVGRRAEGVPLGVLRRSAPCSDDPILSRKTDFLPLQCRQHGARSEKLGFVLPFVADPLRHELIEQDGVGIIRIDICSRVGGIVEF